MADALDVEMDGLAETAKALGINEDAFAKFYAFVPQSVALALAPIQLDVRCGLGLQRPDHQRDRPVAQLLIVAQHVRYFVRHTTPLGGRQSGPIAVGIWTLSRLAATPVRGRVRPP